MEEETNRKENQMGNRTKLTDEVRPGVRFCKECGEDITFDGTDWVADTDEEEFCIYNTEEQVHVPFTEVQS